ncbi:MULTISPECIES: hypothetical protein [Paenibacillus]|jgi:hypothetical protein|uniref:YvrJ family protein n=2 Tax=Paenibacillus barengoltzii TaxID=343517 RepID=R9LIY7_9BACL|nr:MULTISPECIES: hypothetical protein [Paenibacillus]EOS55712.1 hypothetical protein C812_02844 [Paenibacillus barengoltzii G22]MDU0332007.1 hypothetical protein [Paenibacillus sp. 3LSP]MEC2343617.1 hypothetical protein [Paenibacillus barengoltzii]SME98638.1 hypothetical protein SAMN02744102_00730 [Paenibacillus barengoltzii]SMF34987.1 hypothetical protein SAMN02744124_02563 [Paenibacillus barengoltzii J12]
MQVADIVSLVANVGFPVTLCFILIKYVLQTVGDKLGNIEASLQALSEEVQRLDDILGEDRQTSGASSSKESRKL